MVMIVMVMLHGDGGDADDDAGDDLVHDGD